MKQCILHVGMPKTGTSSIQASLHDGLTDPAFHYCSLGEVNVTRSIFTLFGQAPEKHHTHLGWSAAQIEREREQLHQQLEKVIATAGNATLIFSAETCWGEMNSAEWLAQRLGVPFVEDIYRHDDANCIRHEADLFHFSPAALAWLAAATHNPPVDPAAGEQAALVVSAQMHQLRLHGARQLRFHRLLSFGKRQWRRLTGLAHRFSHLPKAATTRVQRLDAQP